MKFFAQALLAMSAAVCFTGCSAAAKKETAAVLPPFQDTYRWHAYHLTKENPTSADGVFRLISVSHDGDVELESLRDGSRRVLKLTSTEKTLRLLKSDFSAQSAEFESLTTN